MPTIRTSGAIGRTSASVEMVFSTLLATENPEKNSQNFLDWPIGCDYEITGDPF
jgi:hypothetical protein